MRMRIPLLAGALSLAIASPASACNWWFAASYMPIPTKISFGVGASGEMSDPSFWGISGDVAMKLGDKAVVRPAVGMCMGNDETDPYFGAGVAFNLSSNANMSINLQSGISYLPFDGGSEMTIPIGAAASFKGSDKMSWYAGASLWWTQFEVDDFDSVSDSDPVLFGGVNLKSGAIAWTLGGQLFMGDDTEFGIVVGAGFNQAANAIRRIGSAFRK